MSSGRTHKSNCFAVRKPSLRAASRKLMSSRNAVSAIFGHRTELRRVTEAFWREYALFPLGQGRFFCCL